MPNQAQHKSKTRTAWLQRFNAAIRAPSAMEQAFFEDRNARGLGVGLNEDGEIIRARDRKDMSDARDQ